jgi:uroporphyrinogen decarboxylase
MNSKERVTRALNRQHPDRVPMTDSFWEDTLTRWYGEGLSQAAVSNDVFGEAVSGIPEYFDFDFDYVSLDASPRLEQKLLSDDGEYIIYQDRFGYTVKKSKGKSRTMDFMDHATKGKADWERIKERFVLDLDGTARMDQASYFMHMDPYPTWAEAKRIFDGVRRRGRYVLANAYGPWEATWRHRGFTELLMDLVTNPDFVMDMAGTYMDLLVAVLQRCLDEGIKPDGLFMVEDLAYTRGMLMSPRSWRQIFKPLVCQLGKFLDVNGIAFWMHCCGNAEAIFDDLIECGLQVIQPLEAKSGLDVRELRKTFGNRLTFWGNIDVINMANGTDEEIDEEIQSKLAPFVADGGGYIYHSDHSVPPEVSFERYQLVLDLVRKYGTP